MTSSSRTATPNPRFEGTAGKLDVGTQTLETAIDTMATANTKRMYFRSVLVFLLVSAILLGTFEIAVSTFGRPTGSGEFGDVFGLANAVFSGLALIGVVVAILHQNRAFGEQIQEIQRQTQSLAIQNVHRTLETALLEYRSVEMFAAVKHLWGFHKEYGDNLVKEYERIRRADEVRIASLPEHERLESEKLTLHYRRQLVSRFYQFLSGLVNECVVPREMIYRYWNRGALRIIPEVLEPIEWSLDSAYNLGQSCKGKAMRDLYDKSPVVEPLQDCR
jgi:hypothetical protein